MNFIRQLVHYGTRLRKAGDPQEACFCVTAIVQLMSMLPERENGCLASGVIFVEQERLADS